MVATAGATGPPASQPNALETSAAYPLGTQTYTYNNRDQLTNITGATSASYTYDANGNRLTQTTTTKTTRYHWNAQDQLVSVEQDSGSGAQTLANYRYNADNLRAEKHLSDAGLYNATQSSQGALSTPLASQRIQWDGLHARRSFELSGANNSNPNNASQTLRSDTDAAVLPGNTAPWLFNRTDYANGQGSTSTTTQLHADANGNLIATVVSEAGAAKADSLLHYNAYGAIDTEASGNASTAISSNANNFGSYYADPETGLLYARARYYDPASGQFISRDPVEGEANLPITWGAYQYGRYNPYRYTDPNGKCDHLSTAADCATELGGGLVGVAIDMPWNTIKGIVQLGLENTPDKQLKRALRTVKEGIDITYDSISSLGGDQEATNRNLERQDQIGRAIDNIQRLPQALKEAVVQFDDAAQAQDMMGNKFTASRMRARQASEAALVVLSAPQAIRGLSTLALEGAAALGSSPAKRQLVQQALVETLAKTDPVLGATAAMTDAAKIAPASTQAVRNASTPARLVENPRGLEAAARVDEPVRTARAAGSVETGVVRPPGGAAANEAVYSGAKSAPKGAQNPKVAEAAARGRQMHNDWDYGPGFRKEVTLDSGKRADAVNWNTREVVELKPNNPNAIRRGEKQVEGYRQELESMTGECWTCRVETYD